MSSLARFSALHTPIDRMYKSPAVVVAGLVLDFINGVYSYAGQTYASVMSMPGATFSNASGGYVQTATGLQQVAPNTPRIGINGYVSELGATNLLANSVGMIGTGWTGQNTTMTANNATAPDGTLTATLNTATATSATGACNYTGATISMTSGLQYTASAFFKGGTAAFSVLNVNTANGYIAAVINNSTGVITSVGVLAGTSFNSVTSKSTSIGNGWWRVEINWTAASTISMAFIWGQCNSATPTFQTGGNVPVTAGQTNYAWGGQVEQASAASSYIPTYGSVTNLLQQSNFLGNSPWTNIGGVTITNSAAIAPDGSQTASLLNVTVALGGIRMPVTVTANTTYTFSFYAKFGTIAAAKYSVYNITGSAELIAATSYTASTSGWTRVSVTFTTPTGCTSVGCYPWRDGAATGTLWVWGCQCELGTTATNFIPVSPAVTNLMLQSNSLSSWSYTSQLTLTANSTTDPNGGTAGWLCTQGANASSNNYYQNPTTFSTGTTYTASAYFKAGTSRYAPLNIGGQIGNYVTVIADLVNGVITQTSQLGAFTLTNSSIKPAPNGWYRVSVSFTVSSTQTTTFAAFITCASPTPTLTGYGVPTGTVGATLYIFGYQIETGYGPNQYVATTTTSASAAAQTSATIASQSSASRSPDTLVLGSALGLSFSNTKAMVTQGSFLNQLSTNQAMAALNDGTASNNVLVGSYLGNFLSQLNIGGSLVKSLYQAANIATPTTVRKQGVSFGNGQYVVSQNGSTVSDPGNTNPAYSGTPAFNQLLVGGTLTVTNPPMNGYVQNVQLFGTALTQTQLNSFTT